MSGPGWWIPIRQARMISRNPARGFRQPTMSWDQGRSPYSCAASQTDSDFAQRFHRGFQRLAALKEILPGIGARQALLEITDVETGRIQARFYFGPGQRCGD